MMNAFRNFVESELSRDMKVEIGRYATITRCFDQYQLENKSDSINLTLHYTALERLTGEMHMDAKLLNGITSMIETLKIQGLVENKETPITTDGYPYEGVILKPVAQTLVKASPSHTISQVKLHEKSIEISLAGKNLDSLMSKIVALLDNSVKLSFEALKSDHKSKRQSRL